MAARKPASTPKKADAPTPERVAVRLKCLEIAASVTINKPSFSLVEKARELEEFVDKG